MGTHDQYSLLSSRLQATAPQSNNRRKLCRQNVLLKTDNRLRQQCWSQTPFNCVALCALFTPGLWMKFANYLDENLLSVSKVIIKVIQKSPLSSQKSNQSNAWDAWRWRKYMWLAIHAGAITLGYHCMRT